MKLLIIAACLVNFGDDQGGVAVAEGDIPDLPKDQAVRLAEHGRALYVSDKDDHTKTKIYTASEALLKAAEAKAKAAAKAAA